MYIEELIIDGFKSYAARTHITGWDEKFNAITGLNGSGKSNILDAICFVLGITNLSHVRANNLQDLVYKRGQAGISKASVTIVFNNNDTSKSPVGYEQYKQITVTRQILIGGRNKYMINGHNSQQQALANLFQSVQLNINNPHFLIMQGKITKVLNMKPPEILAMIAEAAGTRMFEEHKEKAFKTFAKKDKKLEEIKVILDEEIGPKLDKLREEKRDYIEFQKVSTELDFNRNMIVAYQYYKNQKKLEQSGGDFEAKKNHIEQLNSDMQQTEIEIKNIEVEIKKFQDINSKNSETKRVDEEVKNASNNLFTLKAQLDINSKSIKEEELNLKKLKKAYDESIKNLEHHQNENKKVQDNFAKVKEDYDLESSKVDEKEKFLQNLATGVSAKDDHQSGYIQQIQEAKKEAAKLDSTIENYRLSLEDSHQQLNLFKKDEDRTLYENQALIAKKTELQQGLDALQGRIEQLTYDPNGEREISNQLKQTTDQIRNLQERKNRLLSQMSRLEFHYTDPHPKFDRSKVKGLVGQLFEVDDSKFATALEICAGGKLYNVVVDSATTSTSLLKNGHLKSRVTIIPLDKITPFRLRDGVVSTAKNVAPNKVNLALDLIGYPDELESAMAFVFGGTLICEDPDTAKEISSNRRIAKSVTLEGDVYDPSGTLQGGAKASSSGLLQSFSDIKRINDEVHMLEAKVEVLQAQLGEVCKASTDFKQLQEQIDIKKYEIDLIEQRLAKSSYAKNQEAIQTYQTCIDTTQVDYTKAKARLTKVLAKIKYLEKENKEFKSNKNKKTTELENELKEYKASLKAKQNAFKEIQKNSQVKQLQLESMQADHSGYDEKIKASETSLNNFKEVESSLNIKIKTEEKLLAEKENRLVKLIEEQNRNNLELKNLEKLRQSKKQLLSDATVSCQTLQHEIDRFEKDLNEARATVHRLEKEHSWIADQKSQFNVRDSHFDFSKHNLKELNNRLPSLEKKFDTLRKKINLKVMALIDSNERKEADLKQMLTKVKKDKGTIESTIRTLDDYKKEALLKTFQKVNEDFGAIFADLLPGNFAKLEPPENLTLMDGLEVKVCLGGVWKHSLTELSGGQRSLIALSLILSLLQFKPAPMYILDEIDAALDLSHTQNIGQLLKTRFKTAQFIIVSLKDGMFNNANVLFKTKFREGVSMVERISNRNK